MKLNKANILNVSLNAWDTQFLISGLNSFRLVKFLYSSGKIFHNCGPKMEMGPVPQYIVLGLPGYPIFPEIIAIRIVYLEHFIQYRWRFPIFTSSNILVTRFCKFLVFILTVLSLSNNSSKLCFSLLPINWSDLLLFYLTYHSMFWSDSSISIDNS